MGGVWLRSAFFFFCVCVFMFFFCVLCDFKFLLFLCGGMSEEGGSHLGGQVIWQGKQAESGQKHGDLWGINVN